MMQFGSQVRDNDWDQAVRNFRKQFLRALSLVIPLYPQAKVDLVDVGLVLSPSPPHVPRQSADQTCLF